MQVEAVSGRPPAPRCSRRCDHRGLPCSDGAQPDSAGENDSGRERAPEPGRAGADRFGPGRVRVPGLPFPLLRRRDSWAGGRSARLRDLPLPRGVLGGAARRHSGPPRLGPPARRMAGTGPHHPTAALGRPHQWPDHLSPGGVPTRPQPAHTRPMVAPRAVPPVGVQFRHLAAVRPTHPEQAADRGRE